MDIKKIISDYIDQNSERLTSMSDDIWGYAEVGMREWKSSERLIEELDIQFVGVGSGEREYEDFFRYLNNKYPGKAHISLGYSLEIGKKIYSGADIYVMPSLTEPCGLSQIVASRYGVVPIVRETGGLRDSIKDFGCEEGGNGYTFTNYNPNDLQYQLDRAIKDFSNRTEWKEKMKICMSQDFTWKKPAQNYINLYKSVYTQN